MSSFISCDQLLIDTVWITFVVPRLKVEQKYKKVSVTLKMAYRATKSGFAAEAQAKVSCDLFDIQLILGHAVL